MRPKLSQSHQSNGVSVGVATGVAGSSATNGQHHHHLPISQSLTSVASTSTAPAPTRSASTTGIVNPVFVPDLVDSQVVSQHHSASVNSVPHPPPPPTKPKPTKPSKQPVIPLKTHRSASSGSSSEASSGESTVETTASDSNRRTLTTSSVEIGDHNSHHSSHRSHSSGQSTSVKQRIATSSSQHSDHPSTCEYCYRFHANNHQRPHHHQQARSTALTHHQSTRTSPSRYLYEPQLQQIPSYAPYPPQWYYLLAADSKQFRKHKHSHYRKDCKTCRQIVRQTFEQYYLGNNNTNTNSHVLSRDRVDLGGGHHSGSDTPDSTSLVPVSLMSDHHTDPLIESGASSSAAPSPLPMVFLPRRRANCGHSCLKYSILFYCSVAVILAICFICYLTKMFGYLDVMPSLQSDSMMTVTSSPIDEMLPTGIPFANGTMFTNESMFSSTAAASTATTTTTTMATTGMEDDPVTAATASSYFEMVRFEVVGIIVCSAVMIIFFLGLIGAFLESVLCLRIFGAILSYLFLLTFGAALYIIILLVISRVPTKLVLSTISCSAVAITLHAALAIAPFAFADLIYQERQDEKNEISSTYFKYPSVRFLPPGASAGKRRSSYFSLPFLGGGGGGRMFSSRARMMPAPYPIPHHHRPSSSIPTSSARTSPVNHPQGDNLSSEGLIPSTNSHPSTVRFNDNWI